MGPAIPIIGGIAALSLVGLRLRAISKLKATTTPATPIPAVPGSTAKANTAGQTIITTPDGATATFVQPSIPIDVPPAGKRKPTTQEIASSMAIVIVDVVGQDSTAAQKAAQIAFQNTRPDVDWFSPSDADIQAGIALMMTPGFTPSPPATFRNA